MKMSCDGEVDDISARISIELAIKYGLLKDLGGGLVQRTAKELTEEEQEAADAESYALNMRRRLS
jgi:hypothetical protein